MARKQNQMDFPDHIAHKPIFLVPYHAHDAAREENGDTDAQFISVGWAQWDDEATSAKVVRYSGERWSRQSEELPLTRVVDLALLTTKAFGEGSSFTTLRKGQLENQAADIDVAYGSKRDRSALVDELATDVVLKRRLRVLYDALAQLDLAGKI